MDDFDNLGRILECEKELMEGNCVYKKGGECPSGLSRFRRGVVVSHLPRSDKLAPLDHQGDGFWTHNSQQKQKPLRLSQVIKKRFTLVRYG